MITTGPIESLISLGAAGAIIAVVIIFLRNIKERDIAFLDANAKRDKEWRAFFVSLNNTNSENTRMILENQKVIVLALHDITELLTKHDIKVDQRIKKSEETVIKKVNPRNKGDTP